MKDFKINRGIELMLRGAKKKEAEEEPAPKGKGFAITKLDRKSTRLNSSH